MESFSWRAQWDAETSKALLSTAQFTKKRSARPKQACDSCRHRKKKCDVSKSNWHSGIWDLTRLPRFREQNLLATLVLYGAQLVLIIGTKENQPLRIWFKGMSISTFVVTEDKSRLM
jgi:hypothetical protein